MKEVEKVKESKDNMGYKKVSKDTIKKKNTRQLTEVCLTWSKPLGWQ